jgi:hypothetical protein
MPRLWCSLQSPEPSAEEAIPDPEFDVGDYDKYAYDYYTDYYSSGPAPAPAP